MRNKTQDPTVKVKVDIQPGPATPARQTAFRKFFQRLLGQMQSAYHDKADNLGRVTTHTPGESDELSPNTSPNSRKEQDNDHHR